MKIVFRYITISILFMLLISCGNWGWESIETDNEEQLNVFGLISLDDSLESFIVVHKTLDTAGPDEIDVGSDTIFYQVWEWFNEDIGQSEFDTVWYDPPWIKTRYESRYVVKDATVTLSDGTHNYQFIRAPAEETNDEYRYYNDVFSDPAIYLNTDQSFVPQPETDYTLEITTPDGMSLSGSVRTPRKPQIIEQDLPDTLSLKQTFEVSWNSGGDYSATLSTGSQGSWEYYICGIDQFGIMEAGDTTWNSSLNSWCYEEEYDPETNAIMTIRLRFMDDNYYKYFLATDDDAAEISNFLIGEGGIGNAYGVEGGFGVLGAISTDWTQRIAIP